MHDCLHDMIQSDIPIMRFVYSDCILDIRLCLFPVYMFTQFLLNFASTSQVFIAAVKWSAGRYLQNDLQCVKCDVKHYCVYLAVRWIWHVKLK